MTLHEVMHGLVALKLGDATAKNEGRLTLNPIKHVDPFMTIALPVFLAIAGGPIFGGAKPVPVNHFALKNREFGMALVAIAGPLTNLVLAFVLFGVFVLSGVPASDLGGQVLLLAVQVNLGFFLFNIIPLPPLDGSRILYALAPDSIQQAMESVERYGILLVFGVVLLAQPVLFAYMGGGIDMFFNLFTAIFRL